MYNSEKLATAAMQNVQFRETGNSSNTKCTIQRNWQQQQYKMYNSEKLATYGAQDEEKQNKNTTQYVLETIMHKQTQIT